MKRPVLILAFVGICLGTGGWVVVDSGRRVAKPQPDSGGVATAGPAPAHDNSPEAGNDRDRMDRELIVREWPRWLDSDGPDRIGFPAGSTRETSAPPTFVVSATWLQEGHRMAVVNGRVVHEGHRLPPFRILQIRPGLVTFSGPTGDVVIRIRSARRSNPGTQSPPVAVPGSVTRSSRPPGQ